PFPFLSLSLSFSLSSLSLVALLVAWLPFLSLGLRGLAFLFWQLILLSPGDSVSPSPFGLSGLSFLFRLVLPPSSDGCAGHSGFSFLFWLVSPPSSGGCVVSFLPLMRSAMSFCFWICCWPPLRHWFGLGALGDAPCP